MSSLQAVGVPSVGKTALTSKLHLLQPLQAPVALRSRPRPAWQQQQQRDMTASTGVADVYQSLKAALDILKVEPPESVDVPSKQVLVRAAEQIKNDAAKSEWRCHLLPLCTHHPC